MSQARPVPTGFSLTAHESELKPKCGVMTQGGTLFLLCKF